jgi:hypothetical protein
LDPDAFTISIVTMGPGDHPFLKFGHNAIWIENKKLGLSRLYNFGTFSFTSPSLITDFLQGRLSYWLSVQNPRALQDYRRANRSLYVQELSLSPVEKMAIVTSLEENARPENRAYKYDYYLDNCATRVRDVIDRTIVGKLHGATSGAATMSFRHHTLRLVAEDVPLYVGLHLALGPAADRPVTEWDEMFLPEKMREYLRRVKVFDGTMQVPLVARETTMFAAKREPVLSEPPRRLHWGALLGVMLGGGFAALGRSKAKAAQLGFGAALALLGLIAGFLGSVFVFFWAFTDHVIAHKNANIWQFVPWIWVFVVSAVASARGNARARKWNYWIALSALAASFLGLLFKVLPGITQDNALIIACMLPLWLGVAIGCRATAHR